LDNELNLVPDENRPITVLIYMFRFWSITVKHQNPTLSWY